MAHSPLEENSLRELLAADLDVLERGLKLIETEFYVPPNFLCTRSFVDILAQDRHGSLVVIEVKRSDQAAREALHEIEKYRFAIATHFGKRRSDVRCMIASTEWAELARPFSERVREISYDLAGFRLTVSAGVVSAAPFEPLDPVEPLALCPIGVVVLTSQERHLGVLARAVQSALAGSGIDDYLVLKMSYEGTNTNVVNAFGFALIRRSVPIEGRISRLIERGDCESAEECQEILDENPWYVEDCEWGDVTELIPGGLLDEVGILGPEKLQALLADWAVDVDFASGTSAMLWKKFGTDECLREYIFESDRPNATTVLASGRAASGVQRQRILELLDYALMGNSSWRSAAASFLLADSHVDSGDLLVQCYSPADITGLLLAEARGLQPAWPQILLVRPTETGSEALIGYLAFVEATATPFGTTMAEVVGDEITVMFSMHGYDMWRYEDELVAALGLRYEVQRLSDEELEHFDLPDPDAAYHDLVSVLPGFPEEVRQYFSFVLDRR